jgi:hypothetical protein
MPRDINTAEDLLAEILEQASQLAVPDSNPHDLTSPIDQVDVWLEERIPDEEEKPLQPTSPDEWLPEHDYLTDDGQPDVDDSEDALETLRFYVEDERHPTASSDFEFQFRAFLHNNDYSYSADTVAHVLSRVKPSAKAVLSFLK